MNISAPLGFLISAAMIYYGATQGIKNPMIFVSAHAAAIVIGGTVAAALVCFPGSYFFNMARVFLDTLLGRRRLQTLETIREIVRVSVSLNDGKPLPAEIKGIRNPFLRE